MLQAAPLVTSRGSDGAVHPLPQLNLLSEREKLSEMLSHASKAAPPRHLPDISRHWTRPSGLARRRTVLSRHTSLRQQALDIAFEIATTDNLRRVCTTGATVLRHSLAAARRRALPQAVSAPS